MQRRHLCLCILGASEYRDFLQIIISCLFCICPQRYFYLTNSATVIEQKPISTDPDLVGTDVWKLKPREIAAALCAPHTANLTQCVAHSAMAHFSIRPRVNGEE